jgi:hypothetical protein
MTRLTMPHRLSASRGKPGDLPGLRVMHSRTFRTVLASTLLAIGVVALSLLLLRQIGAPDGQYGIDFGDYHAAAQRLAVGLSPYASEMLAGPTDAQGVDRYRYPPLMAQLLQPLTGLEMRQAALVWLLIQAAAVCAAMWIGSGIGGAARTLERGLWCAVAAVYFLPVFDTLWKGNVSGILALTSVAVACGGAWTGLGASAGALLKAVPGTLLPAALVCDRRSRRTALLVVGTAVGVSFALSPAAWLEYPTVVANMLGGSADYATNLAPAAVLQRAGLSQPFVLVIRLVSVLLAAGAIIASVSLARTRAGLAAAALLGVVAMLLLPGSLWYHYLVVLLPFAAIAWPGASITWRVALFSGASLVTAGLAWLPMALVGAVALAGTTLVLLWPTGRPSAAPLVPGQPS